MGNPVPGAVVGEVYNPSYNINAADTDLPTASVPPVGPLSYTSSDPGVVSVDPTTGVATMAGAGTATITVVDTGNNLTDTTLFTVAATAPVPTKLTVEYTLAT